VHYSGVGCPLARRQDAVHKIQMSLRDFGHSPRCKCDLPSPGILRSVKPPFVTDVSGHPIGPFFKVQDGADRVHRNLGNK